MLAHVVAMGLAAPLVVLAWRAASGARAATLPSHLAAATIVQIGLLWGWHIPGVFSATAHGPLGMAAMHGSLFLAAVWFWQAVADNVDRDGWKALAALLLTGKLFCLLGVLLTFAPRAIFGHAAHGGHQLLADQQLAGLVMLTACPVIYVGAAIVIARRWLAALQVSGGWVPGARS